ncbi:C25 family cysteine peptidase, partial [Vibrio sp. FNV 38]|nr:C25 family cysteine peptidase [Vibrio sp. FNV 38]
YLGFGQSDFTPTRIIETSAFKTASDDWFTDFRQTGYATLPIGRLPVRSTAEADLVVSKIVNYEQRVFAGAWNSQAVFIADQNVDTNFSNAASAAAGNLPAAVSANHIYTDGLDTSTARSRVLNALNAGALLV